MITIGTHPNISEAELPPVPGGCDMDKSKRDIPKTPIVELYFYGEYYKCPCCEMIIMKYDREKKCYCCRCGQALDWQEIYANEKK